MGKRVRSSTSVPSARACATACRDRQARPAPAMARRLMASVLPSSNSTCRAPRCSSSQLSLAWRVPEPISRRIQAAAASWRVLAAPCASGWAGAATITSSSLSQGRTRSSGWVCGPSIKPTSTSRPTTAVITVLVLPMARRTGLCGCRAFHCAINGGSRYSPIVRLAAMRSAARCGVANKPCSSPACSSWVMAPGSKARPFSLSTRRRPMRSNNSAPRVASSSASAALAADCERATRTAAARVEPSRAVATKTSSWRSVRRRRWSGGWADG